MLSIVIPTYNEEKYLPRLLQSIRLQSFADYEIIVADNNSTDATVAIAKQYGAIITSGGLPGKGRNEGAKIAQGNILLFLDADVILQEKDFLSDCLLEFLSKKLDIATCCITPLSDRKVDVIGHEAYNIFMTATEKFFPYAPGFCIFARKSVHDRINAFDEAVIFAEDSDYVQRAKKIAKFGLLKSHKIPVSVRRLERDGRLNIVIKYILASLHIAVLGSVKTNIFNYTFGYEKKEQPRNI
jgi:glycosyltransferase involved in cell wall biosynthesis